MDNIYQLMVVLLCIISLVILSGGGLSLNSKKKSHVSTSVLKRFRPGRSRFELESGRYLAAACRVACQRLRLDEAQASTAARRRQLRPEAHKAIEGLRGNADV